MGLFSSLFGGGKKTTNTTTTTDQTQTPIVPDWLQQPTQDLFNQTRALGSADPQSYIAGTNSLLGRAQQGASDLTGTPWNYDAAGDLARGVSNTGWADAFINGDGGRGAKGSTYLKDYMNPYEDQVVRATSDDLGQFEGATRARQALAMAGNGAFGGSGAALTQGQTEGELARARASTIGGLRSRGFETAVSAGQGDAGRYLQDQAQRFGFGITAGNQRLNAADSIRANANDFGANSRANIGAQQSVGDAMRGVQQDQAQAPLDLMAWQNNNYPPWLQQLFGQKVNGTQVSNGTQTGGGGLLGGLGTIATGIGALGFKPFK